MASCAEKLELAGEVEGKNAEAGEGEGAMAWRL
jgi:hypothetical protein